ncbi:MAG: spore germination protein [Firmicutes bacterium]|nr:spore germination protein [Bacillota bacterium]
MARQQETEKVFKKLDENLGYLKKRLDIGEVNFDVILRELAIGGKKSAFLFVDGLTNNEVFTLLLQILTRLKKEDLLPNPVQKLVEEALPHMEITLSEDLEELIKEVLAGQVALFIDGERQAVVIDIREYPIRSPEEPDIEKITRGSRDGFVETLVFNVALIRRRIRDPQLRVEAIKIGRRSSSDVVLMYIKDIASPSIIEGIRSRINRIDADAFPMAEKSLEESIAGSSWNPFPKVRYTERPDVAAATLLEGHVVILVDTSPSVMVAPVTFFHHLQHAEEYRHNSLTGTYIRWVRAAGVLLSFFLIPVWLLLATEAKYLPPFLSFIGPKEKANLPLFLQFVIAHFGLDLIRMASVHTPTPFATALGLVGALLIGEIAVEVGFFTPEVLLYTGIIAIGVFSTPSWELSMANRVVLLAQIVLTGLFKLPGLLIGAGLLLLGLATTKSFGFPYLWPLIPFEGKALFRIFYRQPFYAQRFRPGFLQTIDRDRLKEPPK